VQSPVQTKWHLPVHKLATKGSWLLTGPLR